MPEITTTLFIKVPSNMQSSEVSRLVGSSVYHENVQTKAIKGESVEDLVNKIRHIGIKLEDSGATFVEMASSRRPGNAIISEIISYTNGYVSVKTIDFS